MDGFWSDFQEWISAPFRADMNALHWFLLIGLILVCIVIWNIILGNLVNAIKGAS